MFNHAHKKSPHLSTGRCTRYSWRHHRYNSEPSSVDSHLTNLDVERNRLRSECATVHVRGNIQRICNTLAETQETRREGFVVDADSADLKREAQGNPRLVLFDCRLQGREP